MNPNNNQNSLIKKFISKTKLNSKAKNLYNPLRNPIFKSSLILSILLTTITITNSSPGGSSSRSTIIDWESSNYNKTGICESITSPTSKSECFSQTNETHSCCIVKFNRTYADPTIIDFYPAPVVTHRLRLLGGALAADTSHSTDQKENKNEHEFDKCVAVYKGEKAITSMVRKFNYNGMLLNNYFECNTTQKVQTCGMAKAGKFQDCNSHSSKEKKCCMISYLEMKTCGLDLGLAHNNSNHLGVNFHCNASSIKFNAKMILFVFLVLMLGVFV